MYYLKTQLQPFFIFKNEFFQSPLSVCKLMVSSPLLSLLPVTKTVQFVAVITYMMYIPKGQEKMKNADPGILKFLWHSVFLFISMREGPDNRFLYICSQLFILN